MGAARIATSNHGGLATLRTQELEPQWKGEIGSVEICSSLRCVPQYCGDRQTSKCGVFICSSDAETRPTRQRPVPDSCACTPGMPMGLDGQLRATSRSTVDPCDLLESRPCKNSESGPCKTLSKRTT